MLIEKLNKLPPNLVRVLARVGSRSLSNKDISLKSGLTVKRVGQISRMRSWVTCTVAEADSFSAACGVDLVNQSNTRKYLMRGPSMAHVKRSPNKEYLLELLKLC